MNPNENLSQQHQVYIQRRDGASVGDGQRFWANVTLTALFNDSGELRGFAKVTRDMTEYRRAQEERIRLERAEEALRLRDQFLHDAGTSLNAILVSIRIHVQSLASAIESVTDETSPTIRAKLTTLEWGLDRLSERIEDVLRLAADAGNKLVQQVHQREH
jgi:signal transduction histidine kinase